MTRRLTTTALSIALAFASVADARVRNVTDPEAPRALPAEGRVAVEWSDPAGFTELKYSGNRRAAARGNWVFKLAEHLRETAEDQLPAGQRLEVTITDIRRAGRYEPWRSLQMQDVRIMRDRDPPRMEFDFQRLAEDGRVIESGQRALVDASYLMRSSPIGDGDPLRYEKAMIDRWLRSEFDDPQVAASP